MAKVKKDTKEFLKIELDFYLRTAQIYAFTLFAFIVIYIILINFFTLYLKEYIQPFLIVFIFSMCLGIILTAVSFARAKKILEQLRALA